MLDRLCAHIGLCNHPIDRGEEAPKILAFKEALGLSDEEAAPVFIEVRLI